MSIYRFSQLFTFGCTFFALFISQHVVACSKPSVPVYSYATYYQGATGLTGASLKQLLNQKIANQTVQSYGCLWTVLAETDAHPSVANSVIAYYSRRAIAVSDRDFGMNTPDVWNREHIWAQSHGARNGAARSDAHHVRAADKSVNADRASKDFDDGGSMHNECLDCFFTGSTWEAPDIVKGDTARMMFYMAVRYEGGDNSGTSDLELVDSTTGSGTTHGKVCALLQWHKDDPVDSAEQARHELVYQWQGNRNPFIDDELFAYSIWGEQCNIEPPEVEEDDSDNDIPLFSTWWIVSIVIGVMVFGRRLKLG